MGAPLDVAGVEESAEGRSTAPGASSRELSARALIVGCGIGVLLAALNVYAGLKIGYSESGNLTAAILAFAIFEALRPVLRARFEPLENNIAVTAASSAAAMAASVGVVGPIAALRLLDLAQTSGWGLAIWGIALAVFGVLIAAILARLLIDEEPLPFPTGKATAELIRAMDSARREGLLQARALMAAAAIALSLSALRDGPEWIPAVMSLPVAIAGTPASALGLGMAMSPMMLGTGALIGSKNALGLLFGSAAAWAVIAPSLVSSGEAKAEFPSLVSWLMWPGVALIVTSALVEIALGWRLVLGAVRDLLRASARRGALLRALLVLGVAGSISLLAWALFEVPPIHALLATGLAIVLVAACVRAAGETDQAPIGAMGGLTQILSGLFGAQGPAVTLVAGGIVSGAAAQSSHMMWSLKAGRLLGASQKWQWAAQLVGAVVGACAVVPVYALVLRGYGLGTTAMPASAPLSWKATAEVVSRGAAAMPQSALWAALSGAVVAILLAAGQRTRIRSYLPSPVGAGVAFLLPASYTAAIILGALIAGAVRRSRPAWAERQLPAVAAGTIAGESLAGLAVAALRVAGLF